MNLPMKNASRHKKLIPSVNMGNRCKKICKKFLKKFRRRQPKTNKVFDFQALPNDIKREIASFLSTPETLRLLQTCKSMPKELGTFQSCTALPKNRFSSSGDDIFVLSRRKMSQSTILIAEIVTQEVHDYDSIAFHCDWVNQGYGSQKGQLFIVAKDQSTCSTSISKRMKQQITPFEDGQLVYESPQVSNFMSSVVAPFNLKPNKVYQIWSHVGDAMEDLLHFKNVSFHYLGFGKATAPRGHFCWRHFSYRESLKEHEERMTLRLVAYFFQDFQYKSSGSRLDSSSNR